MPARKLKEFLDDHHVRYVTINHSPAFTAQEIAASAHIPGKELAKTVMVDLDGELAMAVVPASRRVDLARLKGATGAEHVELAKESQFADRFPECELGAMPPFGNLYDMKVFADVSLIEDEQIAFNAGTHSELVQLPYKAYADLVHPKTGRFAT
jgi:Ala-tRNA(Pro) deacylase